MEHDKLNTVKLDSVTRDHDSGPSPLNRPGTGGQGVGLHIRVGFLVLSRCTVGYATPAAAARVVMPPGPGPAGIMIRVTETAVASGSRSESRSPVRPGPTVPDSESPWPRRRHAAASVRLPG
jgi:hypothetical protein